ncbi:GreA/GreB family elongation factor [Aeromonas caviae]|uniref:GreA/GreB family elongation factor n=1 Tax=Aeromonas caviae TaxID=648 RepID=A0AAW9F0C2_AERCA|nr:GreA/GreB family elongation factor [Aeromonas caviae]MDX7719403.1 GreA/GreB family elongation factor [Aeromonas caviae]
MDKQYITEAGKVLIEQRIAQLHTEISEIQAEKAIAYTASGDTWHDNPGFNALEQAEHRKVEEVFKLKATIQNAVMVNTAIRNTSTVGVGSIVECIRMEGSGKDLVETEECWEIGGLGESDPKAKIISYETPIAAALMGHKMGEETEAIQLQGKRVTFEIIKLHPSWDAVSSEGE